MKYNDLFPLNRGLYTEIFKKEFEEDYLKLFDDLTPQVLDAHAFYHYGDKLLSNKINTDNYIEIVKSIIFLNKSVWITKKDLLSLKNDITRGKIETRTKTGTVDVKNNDVNITLEGSKSFNDEEFRNREKTNSDREGNKKEEYNITDTRSVTNSGSNFTTDIKKEIDLRNQNLYRQIITEVSQQLTLKIY